ncbi:hypothetical protein ACFYUV_44530 [Nonomuraea sp. NPDC003560]|uniref:hypothetical protein n=1 Tax=Nonomuraea sp. NPDC003560 TaxID=3364341 RepID=UPI00367C2223
MPAEDPFGIAADDLWRGRSLRAGWVVDGEGFRPAADLHAPAHTRFDRIGVVGRHVVHDEAHSRVGLDVAPALRAGHPWSTGIDGSVTFFRQLGGTAGTAIYLSLLFALTEDRITAAFRRTENTPASQSALHDPAVTADPSAQHLIAGLHDGSGVDLNDTSYLDHLDPRLARPVLDGMAGAMDTVFVVVGCVMASRRPLAPPWPR